MIYQAPEMKVLYLEESDVLTASSMIVGGGRQEGDQHIISFDDLTFQ